MTISPFDHPLLSSLLGDEEAARAFSVASEITAMIAVERALAEAEAAEGVIEPAAAQAIQAALDSFAPDMGKLRTALARDGVVVPELVRQIRLGVAEPFREQVHFGATSQDIIDTALMLRLKPILDRFDRLLADLIERLAALNIRFGGRTLTGVTRMQPAIPIRVSDRLAAWRQPLERDRERLKERSERLLAVQLGGAAGTLDKLGGKAAAVRAGLATRLGLADAPQWHSQRDGIAEFAGWLSLTTGSLGKIGQDIALMALSGSDIALSGGGGSSAMPHKQNPVAAEALVALARFNATQLAGMHQALVHEYERSGAAWMLEWLILPQMVTATAGALRLAVELAGQIEGMGTNA
ncbi:3-carboxy-cis,cis-muconate cycloisomerase [Mesorhizobium sp. BAC0120]|uniref:3-carboxy-cis,cis-muconate cycloisomerase n=1 Tax=Mesorhizobium sp. BAC0120 TaxID=3090670 RepID=UPI00298D2E0A|nr:3-carboxy-cis,cis-muconate cycloisomerase [Mesorhizobium sp. BAC0120]MDW6026275.1 3-carboxy-cis,cis-muconate cycloisomerase [Mesorhizobium sp. BAC0120]